MTGAGPRCAKASGSEAKRFTSAPMTDSGVDWLRPIISGLVAAVVVAVLAALAGRAPPDKTGWRRIVPSGMHWTGIALGGGLVLLMSYVRLFVGSSRADAESQMTILTWLIVGLAAATIATALSMAAIRRRAVRWRGARLIYRRGGQEHEADPAAVTSIRNNLLGQTVLGFADGSVLRLDPYARGARELLEAAEERLSRSPGAR